jgi:hypothetical protein
LVVTGIIIPAQAKAVTADAPAPKVIKFGKDEKLRQGSAGII